MRQSVPVETLRTRLGCRVEVRDGTYLAFTEAPDETLRAIIGLEQEAYHVRTEESGLDEVFSELTRVTEGGVLR